MEEREEESAESIEPTPSYFRAKRNAVLTSSLLIISIVIGIKSSSDGKIAVFPIALENWRFIDEILIIINLYFFVQAIIYWVAQGYFVRNSIQYRYDFYLSASISCFAFFIYFMKASLYVTGLLKDIIPVSDFYLYDVVKKVLSNNITAILFSFLATVIVFILARYTFRYIQKVKDSQIRERENLRDLLVNENWILQFNPNSEAGRKEISFEQNGKIGIGKNQNETMWRLRGVALEILNSNDRVFSRFSYDSEREIFKHTNDDDTLSLPSQWIAKSHLS